MISNNKNYYIFGAHSRGYTLYQYLRALEPEREVLGFFYDNDEQNPELIDDISVYDLNETLQIEFDTDAVVYLGTRGIYHDALRAKLKSVGFSADNIIPVTPDLDMKLRNEYVRLAFEKEGKSFDKIDSLEAGSASVSAKPVLYIAKTIYDGAFEEPVDLKEYEEILQAGTALADNKLADASFYDNDGENISGKNRNFCELTAMYWIWKNSKEKLVGLEHWRRRFLLPDNWTSVMTENGYDVILPVPLCVMPSLKENFVTRHLPMFWNATMDIIAELYPGDAVKAEEYFENTNLYSPCNMLIAKKEIFDDYSDWLFPILLELNKRVGEVEDKYQNRYPGFVSERLLNYYFNVKRTDLKVLYSDKSFLK